ncbi:hypothetical protein DRE_01894 [Drechslerella stenobrocha 248]|uniref:Gluconokinase n=1 Tax=Drechslerella stenobrocha 248 TaxID=1043628 RepID=W7I9B1_9PEZI|nr:hypothetical protein DRE_01894 [Drechslerella stenobrocha 248]
MESPGELVEDANSSVHDTDRLHVPRIFIVAGPAATGKSTVAKGIAATYGLPMVEGDDLHSKENIEKMSQGQPLTDEDRWGWLQEISSASLAAASPPTSPPEELGSAHPHPPGCITTCSALKKSYRDLLRDQLSVPGLAVLRFVFLTASEEVLLQRIEERENHYMKKNMVHSQIVTAEVPRTTDDGNDEDTGDEREVEPDCRVIWTDEVAPEEVVEKGIEVVKQMMLIDGSQGSESGAANDIDEGEAEGPEEELEEPEGELEESEGAAEVVEVELEA